ncbi:hypothetical protein [Bordetella holmesii]|uniref:hypothetical protein n=1 Tax=Bordetella holmesii TaxID=35814 RepID=UPI000A90ECC4|nr:hypothetical protein [Bordetella holmesii]MBO1239834.1 hypothetical protein [Bordetella holmesii]MBO1243892.1 hypothetical protein [Bordetella holmesii]MBO1247033.1 hypothetical protein [Bordetella holmesii]MBO1251805.1 hypothetical protein [Bordetella holmesii]MBO1258043.1 hypothetical protein [Bordetella holmesii]
MTTVTLPADALLAHRPAAPRPRPLSRPVSGTSPARAPAWPFQAPAQPAAAPDDVASQADAEHDLQTKALRRRMAWDVVMVLSWGAAIPGLMWLGAAFGF